MKGLIRAAAAAAIACLATVAQACDMGLHVATVHQQNAGRQNINPGAWAMCDGWTGGAYRNSRNTATAYAGYTVQLGPVDVTAGVATGYGKPVPLAVPSVAIGHVRVALFPSYRGRSAGVHLMLEVHL
jgi:hypothetical protein